MSNPFAFKKIIYYLFLAVLGPHCCAGFSLVVVCGWCMCFTAVASFAVEHRI